MRKIVFTSICMSILCLLPGCGFNRLFFRSATLSGLSSGKERVEQTVQSVTVLIKRASRVEEKAMFGQYAKVLSKSRPALALLCVGIINNDESPVVVTPQSMPFQFLSMHDLAVSASASKCSLSRAADQNEQKDLFAIDLTNRLVDGKLLVKAHTATHFLVCAYEKDVPATFTFKLFDNSLKNTLKYTFLYS